MLTRPLERLYPLEVTEINAVGEQNIQVDNLNENDIYPVLNQADPHSPAPTESAKKFSKKGRTIKKPCKLDL